MWFDSKISSLVLHYFLSYNFIFIDGISQCYPQSFQLRCRLRYRCLCRWSVLGCFNLHSIIKITIKFHHIIVAVSQYLVIRTLHLHSNHLIPCWRFRSIINLLTRMFLFHLIFPSWYIIQRCSSVFVWSAKRILSWIITVRVCVAAVIHILFHFF